MRNINLLIKPASGRCNIHCEYCFYHSLANNRDIKNYGFMSIETLEKIVERVFEYSDGVCTFAFQGGEPTLVGLEFYEKLIELQNKYNTNSVRVVNVLQTNGIVIDDRWASFLSRHRFLVGISLDGPNDIHDEYRVDAINNGTHNRVMNAIRLLKEYNVEYNILSVITSYSAKRARSIYNFYKKNDIKYVQLIPCIDSFEGQEGSDEYSLKPKEYTSFLKNIFDLWYSDLKNNDAVNIRYFENLINMLLGYNPESCGMFGRCFCQNVIEADGSIYPCDFYVFDEWNIGNIWDLSFVDIHSGDKVKEFINKSKVVEDECMKCKWLNICRGGCRRNRDLYGDKELSLNYYCESYKDFFEYAIEMLQEVANRVRKKCY